MGWKDLMEKYTSSMIKYSRGIKEVFVHFNHGNRNGDWENWPKGVWLHGATGTGKSSLVFKKFGIENVYMKDPTTKWWDGFDPLRHKVILIDDYPNTEPKDGLKHVDLLHILQPFPFQGQTKGGFAPQLGNQKIYITSNFTPDYIWPGLESGNGVRSLTRRIWLKEVTMPAPNYVWIKNEVSGNMEKVELAQMLPDPKNMIDLTESEETQDDASGDQGKVDQLLKVLEEEESHEDPDIPDEYDVNDSFIDDEEAPEHEPPKKKLKKSPKKKRNIFISDEAIAEDE